MKNGKNKERVFERGEMCKEQESESKFQIKWGEIGGNGGILDEKTGK